MLGEDGVEQFVATPELQSDNSIGGDPLEPGQVWTISPGSADGENPGLFKIEIHEGSGSGYKILNRPAPSAFRESVSYAHANLEARSRSLIGDKDPRGHEFQIQLQSMDASKSGAGTGVAVLAAMCTALLGKSLRGGLIVVGEISLGGGIAPVYNAVTIAEIAVEKGASTLLLPVSCRRDLIDLSDEMATRVDIQFYKDAAEVLMKGLEG